MLGKISISSVKIEIIVLLKVVVLSNVFQCENLYKKSFVNAGRLNGHVFESFNGLTLKQCVDYCLNRSVCRSVNYHNQNRVCELNDALGDTTDYELPQVGIFHIEVDASFTSDHNGCVSRSCSRGTRCMNLREGEYECVKITCGKPPVLENSKPTTEERGIGTILQYRCHAGYFSPEPIETVCNQWREWSSVEGTCRKIASCTDLKKCNPSYTDGEYWLFPTIFNGEKVKIYCNNMISDDPGSFVTLYENNYSVLNTTEPNGGCNMLRIVGDTVSNFNKIRVDTATMAVDRDDYTFATTTITVRPWISGAVKYGVGGDCTFSAASCPKLGVFEINTRGTGFIVDPGLSWKAVGYLPRMDNFYRSPDEYIIRAFCGGRCGLCEPDGELTLHLESNSQMNPDLATMPTCV